MDFHNYGNIFDDDDLTIEGGGDYSPRSSWYNEDAFYNSAYFQGKKAKTNRFRYSLDYHATIERHAERTKNLVNSITGKELELKLADNYGIDKKAIYLNTTDNALSYLTNDGFLGKISQLLAKGLFYNAQLEREIKKTSKQFLPLFYALEQARNQEQLAGNFGGARYYLTKYWNEAGQDELAQLETINSHPLLKAIFERGNNFKPIEQPKLAKAVEAYLNARKKTELNSAFNNLKQYFTPNEDDFEQMKQERDAKSLTNNELTGSQKRQAQTAGGVQASEGTNEHPPQKQQRKTQLARGKQGGLGSTLAERTGDQTFYARTHRKHAQLINLITKQLASILKDNETKRYTRNLKRGKINKKALHKIATGNDRLFKKQQELNAKRYAFAVCLDKSGSMGGELIQHASEAVVVVCSVLENLNLPFALYSYNNTTRRDKDYHERSTARQFEYLNEAYGGTDDTGLFRQVFADLYGLNDTTALVLTDGESANYQTARKAREQIEQGNNRVFGIGIGGIRKETLDRTFDERRTLAVGEIGGLKNELVSLLRKQFKRS